MSASDHPPGRWATVLTGWPGVPVLLVGRDGRLLQASPEAEALLVAPLPSSLDMAVQLRPVDLEALREAHRPWTVDTMLLRDGEAPMQVRLVALPDGEAVIVVLFGDHRPELPSARLYAHMTHELRGPLGVIIGFAEDALVGLAGPLSEEASLYFRTIHNAGRRQLRLVNDVIELAKWQAGAGALVMTDFSLQEELDAIKAAWPPQSYAEPLDLDVSVPPNLRVHGDRDKVRQALESLIVEAHRDDSAARRVRLSAASAGSWVRITITHAAAGISPAELPHLFEDIHPSEHRRLDGHEASGLELALAKRLIERHGGCVEVTSAEPTGLTFTLILPAARASEWQP